MPRLLATEWLILAGATLLIGAGLLCISVAIGANVEAVETRQRWVDSGAAERAERAVAQPTPIWLPAAPGPATVLTSKPVATRGPLVPARSNAAEPLRQTSAITLMDAGFAFLDPPQPGARARLSLRVSSAGPAPGALTLSIPIGWFDGYRIANTTPPAAPGTKDKARRRLVFEDLPPGVTTLQVDVVSTAEGFEPPSVRFEEPNTGDALGEVHPQTVAPRPLPGPVSALRIPRIGLNVAVVPTSWEPPPFVVGQLKTSANVGQGNTVLVGHLTGGAGAVFSELNQLSPGDTVVAVSRGLEYTFTVSDKQTLPASDSEPVAPAGSPRLTLMTCVGTWDPIEHNFSDRLWVTAEPPELAAATIAANAVHPPSRAAVPANDASDSSATTAVSDLDSGGGLGSLRSSFDAAYGAPSGETDGGLVVYRKGSAEYHVGFTDDPPRARYITLTAVDTDTRLSLLTAVQLARALFPPDGRMLIREPEAAGALVVERWASASLASALASPPGDFLAAYSRDAAGALTRVVVAAGDSLDVSAETAPSP